MNLKLQQEREDTKGLRKSIELVEGHARQQTMHKDSELNTKQTVMLKRRATVQPSSWIEFGMVVVVIVCETTKTMLC